MRFYSLVISNDSGQVYQPNATTGEFTLGSGGATFFSYANGQNIPGALNIEFDFNAVPFNTPQGGSMIRVWGIGLPMIGRSADLNNAKFELTAGMRKGLPLSPDRYGVIAQGRIFQAFGNWQGINQTLDLIVNPDALAPPLGIAFDWPTGVPLDAALRTTFAQAFPTYDTPTIQILGSLQAPKNNRQCSWYPNIGVFSQYLQQITQPLGQQQTPNGQTYPGVQITLIGNKFSIFDGTVPQTPIEIAFQDLVGQPTWIGFNTISFKTVLRSDIGIGTTVKLPSGIIAPYALTSPSAAFPNAPSRSKLVFQGDFLVNEVHHYANFRQPDAESWNTTFTAIPLGNQSGQ